MLRLKASHVQVSHPSQAAKRNETSVSFPVLHEVSNIDIFVQLLMIKKWTRIPMESILMQNEICHGALNLN